jgi:hypothetical protein
MSQDPETTAKRIIHVFICEPPTKEEGINPKRKPNWYKHISGEPDVR